MHPPIQLALVVSLQGLAYSSPFGFPHPCKFCPEEPAIVREDVAEDTLGSVEVSVDIGQKRQVLKAWGASLCWWANGVGGWGDDVKLSQVLDLVFSDFSAESLLQAVHNSSTFPISLGLTQARYNIGGGEAPQYQHFMRPGAAVEGYLSANNTWNWSADATQRKVLAGALQRGVKLVHAFSNSPPAWMTISGSATGNHEGTSNLQEKYYDAFANYLAVVVKRFATDATMLGGRTLTFNAVTPLNEPNAGWWKFGNNQEGCHFSPSEQSTIVVKLASQLKALSVTQTPVSAAEENWVDTTRSSVGSYSQDAINALGFVATHTYTSTIWGRPALASWAASHGLEVWNTEFGTGSGPLQGGIRLAEAIIDDLMHLNCTVWTLWQPVDLDDNLGSGGWGGIAATNPPTAAAFKVRKQHYAFKQFTAFIRPGSQLIEMSSTSSSLKVLGALLPVPHVTILVIVNTAYSGIRSPVTFRGRQVAALKNISAYRTDETHDCERVQAPVFENGQILLDLPSSSITTLVIEMQPSAEPSVELFV